ncbi:PREDICTED: lipid droplet-associated hydrolase isoform X1 [Tarenaya hassleriana]|uniref:lipid droplet-associated hydrolase isoform X1 n=2 Tax=Tarenaya hassleriana TaxID=28532 RepID=UPI00053C4554|nr:PREDICTED: lipid droplet-associated hydrolase isoform X1 [Tarenaya hassleriana]XP_010534398.1 PREDICTED: lipid droplet-associated hydrolase isoform X1 [Tarenaya hassleriana]XP_010534399.1 PREDICTED: lipid droplet-associated hydrolase isoform X1 [Tarenaya hassleriana]
MKHSMLLRLLSSVAPPRHRPSRRSLRRSITYFRRLSANSTAFSLPVCCSRRRIRQYRSSRVIADMDAGNLLDKAKRPVDFRLCKVFGSTTELLEIQAENPTFHVLFITGNPGVASFYKDFVESLYNFLDGNASITAIGHISHTSKDWESGRLFSLQEQIDHKMDFIRQELRDVKVPIVLVGHSVGAYISLEMLRKCLDKVIYCVGLYPFLALNRQSLKQSYIVKLAMSSFLSTTASLLIASLGLLPMGVSRLFVSKFIGNSWSDAAVQAACTHLRQYHTMRNVLFMAKTEFTKLAEEPDWDFMRENQSRLAFLYGIDDHWGPLQMFEEISKQAPGIPLSIEREGHTHGFCCTVAGSTWVAQYVATLVKDRISQLQ